MRRPLLVLALLALVACEGRPPLNRAQVIAGTDSLLLREQLQWGEAVDVLPPPAAAAPDGRRWWQVRYPDAPDGTARIVLFEDETRWSRLPPAGYVPRVAAASREPDPARVIIQPGPSILLLEGVRIHPEDARARLLVDAAELNTLAGRTGLHPAFSVRTGRDGTLSLVYGWQEDHGIARDERVRDWLRLRTKYGDSAVWVDL